MSPATWFETRGAAALLTMRTSDIILRISDLILMRVSDLILRSPPQAGISKDGAPKGFEIVIASEAKQSIAPIRQCGLLRRFTPLRKRFAFVAGNDEKD
jgi:hypothetical protein